MGFVDLDALWARLSESDRVQVVKHQLQALERDDVFGKRYVILTPGNIKTRFGAC